MLELIQFNARRWQLEEALRQLLGKHWYLESQKGLGCQGILCTCFLYEYNV